MSGFKADKAREMIEKFPQSSKKELGRLLFNQFPALFKDAEEGRRTIRGVTGAAHSKTSGIKVTHKDIYKGLPKGLKNDFSDYVLSPGKWGVLSDIHIPYHDEGAVDCALSDFHKKGIKNILLNGDILDCYQVSDHLRDPTLPQLRQEFDILFPWLTFLQSKFHVVYKLGNHEERLERYLIQRAASLFNWPVTQWQFLVNNHITLVGDDPDITKRKVNIEARKKDIDVVQNKRIVKAGKLNIVHGHEFGRQQVFNPVNAARGYFMRAKANVLGGDKHSTSEHIEADINGKIIGAWSTGCLCELHPKYLPINRWNLGYAIVEHDGDEFEVNNLKIINGKVK